MGTSDVTTQAILTAYKRLPAEERRKIDQLAETVRTRIPRPSPGGKGLGKQATLELIGKLGIFLDKHTPVTRLAETRDGVEPALPDRPGYNAVNQRGPSSRGRRRMKHV